MIDKHKRHRLGVYSMDCHFWHCPSERVLKYLHRVDGSKAEEFGEWQAGKAIYNNWSGHLWLNPKFEVNSITGISIITHEAFHLAECIMQAIHQNHDPKLGVNEPMAYLLDHLVGAFLREMQ